MQNRQEWLEWRHKGIGSSDAPIIMDVSPYKTALQLWEEKTSSQVKEDDSNSYIKRKGNEIEPKIRAIFEVLQGQSFQPALVQMEKFAFMKASLDGRSEDGEELIEIKLIGKDDWQLVKDGGCPARYYPQVQHQLLVSGAKKCHLVACNDPEMKGNISSDNLAVAEVLPIAGYQAELLKKCMQFWDLVESKKPPQPSNRDYKTVTGYTKQAAKWKRLKLKAEALETELEEARQELIDAAKLSGHARVLLGGIKVFQISRVGNVDYKKIPELQGLDLEQYRGKGSLYWKVEA